MEQRHVGALARHRRIGFSLADQLLVCQHDQHADDDHDDRQDVADARVGSLQRGVQLGGQYVITHRQTEELRYGE